MHADTNLLVCAGDDGTVISFEYQGAGGGGGAIEPPPRRPAAAASGAGVAGGFGAAAQRRASSGGKAAAEVDVGDGGGAPAKPKQMSQAQAYAEKKRLLMDKAERLKAERMRAREEGWVVIGLSSDQIRRFCSCLYIRCSTFFDCSRIA
jgi:hypothetical protein